MIVFIRLSERRYVAVTVNRFQRGDWTNALIPGLEDLGFTSSRGSIIAGPASYEEVTKTVAEYCKANGLLAPVPETP
jgi:hypothetical protein